jgi:hypothetical protein
VRHAVRRLIGLYPFYGSSRSKVMLDSKNDLIRLVMMARRALGKLMLIDPA